MNHYKSVKIFVLNFFSKIGSIPGTTEEEKLNYDYVQNQMLDSLGIITLITELESYFGINLQAEDLENSEFKKVGGLIKIIESKLGAKNKK